MSLQEAQLALPSDPIGPLETADNVAMKARVSVSSTYPGYRPEGAIDGQVSGDIPHEWASYGERKRP